MDYCSATASTTNYTTPGYQRSEKMHTVKEKVSNAAASGKAHVDIYKANVEEKAEQATAMTDEEKEIAHQRRKAKEAKAKMELHQAKAEHAAGKLRAKQAHLQGTTEGQQHDHHHHHQPPVGTTVPVTGPTYPLGGNPPPPGHDKCKFI